MTTEISTEPRATPIHSPDRFFVGGEWIAPSTASGFDVIESATEERLFRVAAAQPEDMERAIGAARHAFDTGLWPRMTHAERAGYLRAIARELDELSRGRSEGATVATGGGRPSDLPRGYYVEPTVFADVDNSSTIAREEIFGPVLSVIPAEDEADAIRLANDTVYGLNASVFTDDADRALAASRALRSGTVGHNAMRSDFGIAFGGFKQSGIGREGGAEGLRAYLETKTIVMDGVPSAHRSP